MKKNPRVLLGAVFVAVSFVVGCAADETDAEQPAVRSSVVVCGTLQEINDVWFGTLTGDESPDDPGAALQNLSARLAGEVITWGGESDASIRSAAELVSQDLSVINAFNADAPDNVEDSNKFIATLDSFEDGISGVLSLCRESGALESSKSVSIAGDNPIRFELTESITPDSLTDSMTSLGQISRLPNGDLMVVDRPYALQPLTYESMYFRYFDGSTLAPAGVIEFEQFSDLVALSPDGRTFATSVDGGCGLVNIESGIQIAGFQKRSSSDCVGVFSPDGSLFYFSDPALEGLDEPGIIRVAEIRSRSELDPISADISGGFLHLLGNFIFYLGQNEDGGDTIVVLDPRSREVVKEIPREHFFWYSAPDFESSSVYFATLDTAQLWSLDTQSLELVEIAQLPQGVMHIALSPDGRLLALSHNETFDEREFGVVSIFDVARGEVVQEIEVPGKYFGTRVLFLGNERLIAQTDNGVPLHVYDLAPAS